MKRSGDDKAESLQRMNIKRISLIRIIDKRWFSLLLFFAYFSIPFIIHFSHLLAGETLVSGDGKPNIFSLIYIKDSIKNFEFPMWCPYLACGQPYGHNMLYPIKWLCSILPGVIRLYAYFGLHYAIGGVAMFSFLKKIKCIPIVSLATSTIYLFTVHMGGARKEHIGLIVTVLYIPVIFYFLERYLQEMQLKWLLCASAAMALQYLGGFLQYIIYSDIFVFFYLLCSGFHRKFPIKQMLKHGVGWFIAYFGMIFANVLPMMQFMYVLSSEGGSKMSVSGFTSLSLHPVKLLISIFPYLFGTNVGIGLIEHGNFSSGMDAELVIGASAVIIIVAGFTLIRKNFYIRFMSVAAITTFIYACLGQFPFLARIVYQIPILNMFRIPSRILFLTTFSCMIIMAISLNEIYISWNYMHRIHIVNMFVGGIIVTIIVLFPVLDLFGISKGLSAWIVLGGPVALFGIHLCVFYIGKCLVNHGFFGKNELNNILVLVITCLTIFQLFPFYKSTRYLKLDQSITFPSQVSESIGMDKVWSTGVSIGQLTYNESIAMQILTLNSYSNFNLPNLYKFLYHTEHAPMNSSEMYINFPNIVKTMERDNALLSMLGVKYIIVPPGIDFDSSVRPAKDFIAIDTLVEEETLMLLPVDGYQIAVWNIELESNSFYRFSATVNASQGGDKFYFDLFGPGYDNPEQQKLFEINQGVARYEAVLPSNQIPKSDYFLARIVMLTEDNIEVSEMKVEKVDLPTDSFYNCLLETEKYNVFENPNVKPLIYAPERVVSITDESKKNLYVYTERYDVLNTSYITDVEGIYDFSDANVQVNDIVLTNNHVSASVHADKDAFINMSQSYYPGWNAYIDGKKTSVYEVNGLIQGVFVPAGDHLVEFKFQPTIFYIGLCISVGVIAVCIFVSVFSEKNNKKR